jgi:Bax protein
MRLYILLFICLSSISLACADIKEGKGTSSELSKEGINGMDTLIYSNPKNYSYTLEKAEGAANVEVRSYKDMFALFEKHKYTPESWQAGIREVPRIYLPLIGDRWGPTTSKEITIDNKKRLFFRGLAPMVLRANELIMFDRNQLKSIRSSFNENKMSDEDNKWILKLAKTYKVDSDDNAISEGMLDELWERVDIVPVSLALAQAAEESGWGTSRFAGLGNAVYGQWTWGDNAITPEKQRKELGNYGIASFETLQQSICAYMLNLNTHNAYASLRSKRAELRNKEQKVTGYDLAGQLTKYSERGEEYVKGLRSLMEYNRLRPTDEAYLSNGAPVYLVPVAN